MADNIELNSGSGGGTAATDERTIGGVAVHVQRVAPHGGPAITVGQVTVSSSSTAIVAADSTRESLTLVNRQLAAVFIDDAAATTAAFRLDPGDSITMNTGAAIYGITASAYTPSGDDKLHYVAVHD